MDSTIGYYAVYRYLFKLFVNKPWREMGKAVGAARLPAGLQTWPADSTGVLLAPNRRAVSVADADVQVSCGF
jgi:hypothetical protein